MFVGLFVQGKLGDMAILNLIWSNNDNHPRKKMSNQTL